MPIGTASSRPPTLSTAVPSIAFSSPPPVPCVICVNSDSRIAPRPRPTTTAMIHTIATESAARQAPVSPQPMTLPIRRWRARAARASGVRRGGRGAGLRTCSERPRARPRRSPT